MTMPDHRQAALDRVHQLTAVLAAAGRAEAVQPLLAECESLARAISAFHMEGIRFRMFNVDRMLARAAFPLPDEARTIFASLRHDLEAAGFHTRSHQAPG
jgi:hypothetical protein